MLLWEAPGLLEVVQGKASELLGTVTGETPVLVLRGAPGLLREAPEPLRGASGLLRGVPELPRGAAGLLRGAAGLLRGAARLPRGASGLPREASGLLRGAPVGVVLGEDSRLVPGGDAGLVGVVLG